jgi:hypothetical protein
MLAIALTIAITFGAYFRTKHFSGFWFTPDKETNR